MRKQTTGFTLIESIIVMIILASSMTAALYLLTTVVFSTQANLKRTKAVYLAQECTELARNLRDSAWKNYQAWDCAFGSVGNEFTISYDYSPSVAIAACNALKTGIKLSPFTTAPAGQDILWQNGSTLTHLAGGVDSGYARRLKHISSADTNGDLANDQIELGCTVEWNFNGRDESVTATQTLTDWRKN